MPDFRPTPKKLHFPQMLPWSEASALYSARNAVLLADRVIERREGGIMENFFRVFGRVLAAIVRGLLWEPLMILVLATAEGVGNALRFAAPWVVGAAVLWGAWAYEPELLERVIGLVIVIFVMVLGFRVMTRGLRRM